MSPFLYFLFILSLGLIFFIGIIVTIISAHKAAVSKRADIKARTGGIVTGITLMILPVVIFALFIILAIIPATKAISPVAKKAIFKIGQEISEDLHHKDDDVFFKDKWKKGGIINDSKAAYNALETLLSAADKGDADAIISCFPDNTPQLSLKSELEVFLNDYPKGLGSNGVVKDKYPPCSGGGQYEYGQATLDLSTHYEIDLDGTTYYVWLSAVYTCDSDPSEVGVTYFMILNDEGQERYDDDHVETYDHIFADTIFTEGDFWDTKINDVNMFLEAIDRTITQEDAEKAVKELKTIEDFEKRFGKPNAYDFIPDHDLADYACYMITLDDHKFKYLMLRIDHGTVITDGCYICGSDRKMEGRFSERGTLLRAYS